MTKFLSCIYALYFLNDVYDMITRKKFEIIHFEIKYIYIYTQINKHIYL